MVREIVQNLLVYVVMVTILRGLISDKGFLDIFRFVSGLILILLFISPVLSVLSLDAGWYQKLEENIFKIDKMQMEQEMRVADGSFEKVLLRECEEQVAQQIREIAWEEGQISREVDVDFKKGKDGEWGIEQVHMTIGEKAQETMARREEDVGQSETFGEGEEGGTPVTQIEQIQKIVIEPEQEETVADGGQGGVEDKDTWHLKKKICKKYQLPEEVVDVWKINGED